VVHGQAHLPNATDKQRVKRGLEICLEAVRAIVLRNAPLDFETLELSPPPLKDSGLTESPDQDKLEE
jgi:hypothetical protein